MCKFIGKSNGRTLCKLSKSEISRLYSIVHVAMETTATSNLPVNQNPSSVSFSLAKFQLLSCNLSLAMIWQMTYSQTAKTVSLGSFDTTIICMCEKPRHNNGIRRRNPTYLEDVENLGTRLKDLQPKRLCLSLAAHLQSSLSLCLMIMNASLLESK